MAQSPRIPLPFNKDVLIWARKRAGLTVEDTAGKIRVQPDRVFDWETGEAVPTARQGRMLAKTYDRPFLELFSTRVPEVSETDLIPDFRLYSDGPSDQELRTLRDIQRWAEEQRSNALALLEELGEQPPIFSENLKFTLDNDPDTAARISREAMQFPVDEQLTLPPTKRQQLPNIFREKIERMGTLVLKRNSLTRFRARGLCLCIHPLPVIVYGGEAPTAQSFTLAHEFGHVLISTSAISGTPFARSRVYTDVQKTENWCNGFASAFLIPEEDLDRFCAKPKRPQSNFDDHKLQELAQAFSVSRHAMLIRLVALRYVESEFYWGRMRPLFLQEEATYKSFGRPSYYGMRYVNSKGRFYTRLVLEAWGMGLINSHNAAEYMDINNLDHLVEVRKDFGG